VFAVTGLILWCAVGALIIAWGIAARFAKKPVHFWANAEPTPVTDVRRYNRAVGRLFCVYGTVFILLGLSLLAGQNSPWFILSVLGVVFATIITMAVYTIAIEEKYRKK
jgi:phosphatidylglycerophosphate synthase